MHHSCVSLHCIDSDVVACALDGCSPPIVTCTRCCLLASTGGELLCSQGGDPDYMLTVWNWETESTLLRCKAFSQDVYKVTFSPFHPGQLTSAGQTAIQKKKKSTLIVLRAYIGSTCSLLLAFD